MNGEEKEKLRILLDYWIKHNKEHGEEFREWAEKAKEGGETTIYDELMSAVQQMENISIPLSKAMKLLG